MTDIIISRETVKPKKLKSKLVLFKGDGTVTQDTSVQTSANVVVVPNVDKSH